MASSSVCFCALVALSAAFSVQGLDDVSSCAAGHEACLSGDSHTLEAWSEVEVEEEEEAESAMMEVQLLQTKIQTRAVPIGISSLQTEASDRKVTAETSSTGAVTHGDALKENVSATRLEVSLHSDGASTQDSSATKEGVASNSSDGIVSLDHNGRVCMLCGAPLPERVGKRSYTEFRRDCGGRSSSTGPTAADLTIPAIEFAKAAGDEQAPMNGFCALNFAKSCADAVANKDYLYWPKSLDLASPAMSANAPWDARYCSLNGFLHRDIVALQHNFTGMRMKAEELCRTKYAKHGIEKLTFLDMMSKSRYDDTSAPTLQEAEVLAAWNCAMGDLGCDMAMCAYSFCHRDGAPFGLYSECAGWDPVDGMPM